MFKVYDDGTDENEDDDATANHVIQGSPKTKDEQHPLALAAMVQVEF